VLLELISIEELTRDGVRQSPALRSTCPPNWKRIADSNLSS
jgi:hypothetical protein